MTLPDYQFLSAPLWLITVLHVVTLCLHFLAMNFVLGGTSVILFGKITRKWEDPAVARYVKALPSAMAATVTLGVAPLLFLQLVYHQQAYSAAISSAWFWLLIVVAVIVAYYLLYSAAFTIAGKPRRARALLALALVGMAYVSLIYTSVFSMAERPDVYRQLYSSNPSGWAVHADVGAWGFRWLHSMAGAMAVGGFFIGLIGRRSEPIFRLGRVFLLWGMIAAMLAGTAYLVSLRDHLSIIMRSSAIWVLLASILMSLGAMHLFFKRRLAAAGSLIAASVLGMVVVRHVVRTIVLDGHFDPTSTPVREQWDVFAIFLLCFVLAVLALWYMVTLARRMPRETR